MSEDPAESSAALENASGNETGVKRKRAATTTASRTVASLTPEQLEKKRKNDREVRVLGFGEMGIINILTSGARLKEPSENEQKPILIDSMIGYANWSKPSPFNNSKELFVRKVSFKMKTKT
jgi:hypothetical protein